MIRKIAKILAYILTTLISLLALLLFLVHKGSFNTYITGIITEQVSKSIRGELEMDPFTGSLFNEFTLHEVKFRNADTVLIDAGEIGIKYSLNDLIRKRLVIHSLELSEIDIYAVQQADSAWVFLSMFEPVQPPSNEEDKVGDAFFSEIELSSLRIDSLQINVRPQYQKEMIPKQINAFLELNFRTDGDLLSLELHQFRLQSSAPDFEVNQLKGRFSTKNDTLRWEDFHMLLSETDLSSSGSLPLKNMVGANVGIIFSPLAFSDFQPFMTGDTLYGSPEVKIIYEGDAQKKQVAALIQTATQKIELEGWLEGIKNSDSYHVQLDLHEFDGASWTGDLRMKTLITGTMELEGTGYDYKSNRLNFTGNFDSIEFMEYAADTMHLNFIKSTDNAKGHIEISSNRGDLTSSFSLSRIFDQLKYDFTSNLNGIDISSFIPASELQSDLNLFIKAKGVGFDLNTMSTDVFLEAKNSQLLNRPIENLKANLSMKEGAYTFKELDLQTPYLRFFADGEGDVESDNNIRFQLEPYNLNPLMEPYDIPELRLDGIITGTISGHIDSLNLAAELAFDSIGYDSISTARFYSHLNVSLVDSTYQGTIELSTGQVNYGKMRSDSIYLTSEFSRQELDNYLHLRLNDTVSTDLYFRVETGEVPIVHLPGMQIKLNQSTWSGGSDSTFVALGKDTIQVRQFQLTNGSQSIYANGRLAFEGDENFMLTIRNLDLEELGSISPVPDNLKGLLDSDFLLTGNARIPVVKGNINVSAPAYQEIDFSHFQFDIQYRDELLAFKGDLDNNMKQRFYADMVLPLHFSLRDSIYLLKDHDSFRVDIRIDSLNTEIFNPYLESTGIQGAGDISLNTEISNTMRNPDIKGGVAMRNGKIDYEQMGIAYKDIGLDGTFTSEGITLNSLNIDSGDGSLEANGYAGISLLSDQKVKNIEITVSASNFKAVESEKGSAVVNSNLKLSGPYSNAKVEGQITILKSTINTDAIMAAQNIKSENPNPPLLIQAMKDTLLQDTMTYVPRNEGVDKNKSTFYDQLSGTFTVVVPGNTWVKGRDMNFELKGELRAVKEGPQIDLFGDLNVNRGFYKLYGKRFKFDKGKISFTGGREINPVVDFEVTYTFRDEERELRKLKLYLTGRALNPDIRFTIDNMDVEEKDAIAYILFGRRMDNLTTQQSTSVEQSALNLTKDIALGQISNILKDALQSTLHLDVVEISGEDNWQSGQVTIGKYITNDLYVSYEQNFAFDKKNKFIEPDEIALEYQIIRSIFIQATNQRLNSGFDLIFKKSWK